MACPYFDPLAPHGPGIDPREAMLPLGGLWAGLCRAPLESPSQPADASLRPLCNLGYARGNCPCFPAGDGPDAVRFTISSDDGATIGIYYVLERDHHPFAHGPIDYSIASGAVQPLPGEILARQARAYAENYRRRKALTA
jgi:hypothetical protein